MGNEKPLRFSRIHRNALVIQGKVDQNAYNDFAKKYDKKIKSVKTIYIEKNAVVECTLSDCKNVKKVVLRSKPKTAPKQGWLPLPSMNVTLDISRLRTKDQLGDWNTPWECDEVKRSRIAAEKWGIKENENEKEINAQD